MSDRVIYAVLLYPPVGSPRVIELPDVGIKYPLSTFSTRDVAEKSLEEFLNKNPEYRRWKNGHFQ